MQALTPWFWSATLLVSLSACGFHLRGETSTNLDRRISIEARFAEHSELLSELRRELIAVGAGMTEVDNADWVIRLQDPVWSRKVLAVEQGGKRQQLLLTYSLAYVVSDRQTEQELIRRDSTLTRDYLFDPSLVLAMNAEETALKTEMIRDAAKVIRSHLLLLKRQGTRAN